MPIVKHENYTMRDAARETRIYDKTFAKYFDDNTDTQLYDLRTLNRFCDQNKLDTTIAGFPPFPIPVEGQLTPSYEPSLRSYRGYNKINGMYVYNWADMYIPYSGMFYARVWGGGKDYLLQDDRVYFTLPGFEGWHIPTEAELNETVNYYGGFNNAGYYLKNGNWKTPSNVLGLSFSPSGLLNGNGDQLSNIGEKSYYPYAIRDTNFSNWENFWNGYTIDDLLGLENASYRDQNGNRKNIDGDYVKTKSFHVFSMDHNSNVVSSLKITKRPTTIRLVRDRFNTATSFTDIEGNQYGIYTVGNVVWMDRDVHCTYEASYDDCKLKPIDRATFRTLNVLDYKDKITIESLPGFQWWGSSGELALYGAQRFGMSGGRIPELNKHNYFQYPSFSKNLINDRNILDNKLEWREILTPGYRILPYYTS